VVGAARSGTTLLRLMLDAHPQLAIPPETGALVPRALNLGEGEASPEAVVAELTASRRWPDFDLDPDALLERLRALADIDAAGILRSFYGLYAEGRGKPRWGDKTPRNLRRMDRIQAILPEARFVHVIRDGRDVALSRRSMRWRQDSLAQSARQWRRHVRRGRRQARGLRHYLEVRYEALVLAPEETLSAVCEFVELPWDPAMLEYHRTAAERIGDIARDVHVEGVAEAISGSERVAIHALTSAPPLAERVGRWRREASADEQEAIEAEAGDLLDELGYGTGPDARTSPVEPGSAR
jgi:hypothetical protein